MQGGRKPRKLRSLRRKHHLGGRHEGDVFEVEATVQRGKKKRKLVLVEKEFQPGFAWPMNTYFRNPWKQFKLLQELVRLNRAENLGLRIVPTIRIKERNGRKATLLMTRLSPLKRLSTRMYEQFSADMRRQIVIAGENGFSIYTDAFVPVRDKETGNVVAMIADFGNIEKGHKSKRLD